MSILNAARRALPISAAALSCLFALKPVPVLASDVGETALGLRPAQVAALRALTGGRVDLAASRPRTPSADARALPPFAVRLPGARYFDRSPAFLQTRAGRGLADPELEGQWWLRALGVPAAWRLATGRGVTVADCDSGYYVDEADLRSNLRFDQRRDLSDRSRPLEVADGSFVFHGTAVAAIMTGVRDGLGTNGIAFDARLVPLQYFNYDRRLDDLDKEEGAARCVLHALTLANVDVIVLQNQTQQGSAETSAGTREAIELALACGVPVIAAAGNGSVELETERLHDTGSILVGALRSDGSPALFSNYGDRVTTSAFGEGLRTLHGPDAFMDIFGGTTAAAAQVGAAVVLMHEANPRLTPQQVRGILVRTRRSDARNRVVGGQLDVLAAVEAAQSEPSDEQALTSMRRLREHVRQVLAGLDVQR